MILLILVALGIVVFDMVKNGIKYIIESVIKYKWLKTNYLKTKDLVEFGNYLLETYAPGEVVKDNDLANHFKERYKLEEVE